MLAAKQLEQHKPAERHNLLIPGIMPKDKQIVKKTAAGVDNTFRRTWDVTEYEEQAAKRDKRVRSDVYSE